MEEIFKIRDKVSSGELDINEAFWKVLDLITSKKSLSEELERIKDKLLDDFISGMKARDADKFEEVFSYDDIYKIITNLHYKN